MGEHQKRTNEYAHYFLDQEEQHRRGKMNGMTGNERNSCSSAFDPERNPATAAVDRLKYFPDWKFERVRLLSEREEDADTMFGENENENPYDYDVQILEFEKLTTRGTFNVNSLSRISKSISIEQGCSSKINNTLHTTRSSPTRKSARARHPTAKKRRPLVTSIACRSRLCQLGCSSPQVTYGYSTKPCSSSSKSCE